MIQEHVASFLEEDPSNVVAVHCKSGQVLCRIVSLLQCKDGQVRWWFLCLSLV